MVCAPGGPYLFNRSEEKEGEVLVDFARAQATRCRSRTSRRQARKQAGRQVTAGRKC